jgi:hypothetical protein
MYIYAMLIWGETVLSASGLQKLLELCKCCCTYLNVSFRGGEICVTGGLKGCVLCVVCLLTFMGVVLGWGVREMR